MQFVNGISEAFAALYPAGGATRSSVPAAHSQSRVCKVLKVAAAPASHFCLGMNGAVFLMRALGRSKELPPVGADWFATGSVYTSIVLCQARTLNRRGIGKIERVGLAVDQGEGVEYRLPPPGGVRNLRRATLKAERECVWHAGGRYNVLVPRFSSDVTGQIPRGAMFQGGSQKQSRIKATRQVQNGVAEARQYAAESANCGKGAGRCRDQRATVMPYRVNVQATEGIGRAAYKSVSFRPGGKSKGAVVVFQGRLPLGPGRGVASDAVSCGGCPATSRTPQGQNATMCREASRKAHFRVTAPCGNAQTRQVHPYRESVSEERPHVAPGVPGRYENLRDRAFGASSEAGCGGAI